MFGRIMTRRHDCLLKNANLIIMAWKTSDFLVLHEPQVTVLLTKVINIIDAKKMSKPWTMNSFFSKMSNDFGT